MADEAIKEGMRKKGGLNPKPSTPRPNPPKPQTPHTEVIENMGENEFQTAINKLKEAVDNLQGIAEREDNNFIRCFISRLNIEIDCITSPVGEACIKMERKKQGKRTKLS